MCKFEVANWRFLGLMMRKINLENSILIGEIKRKEKQRKQRETYLTNLCKWIPEQEQIIKSQMLHLKI